MDWRGYIHSDPAVLVSKPIIKGTCLAVEFILNLLAESWTVEQVLRNYPELTAVDLQRVFAFAVECVQEEASYVLASNAQ